MVGGPAEDRERSEVEDQRTSVSSHLGKRDVPPRRDLSGLQVDRRAILHDPAARLKLPIDLDARASAVRYADSVTASGVLAAMRFAPCSKPTRAIAGRGRSLA